MKKDPVCSMDVKEEDALKLECESETYYFCSEGCKEKFLKERQCKQYKTDYDLLIIGGGPAGLTAATYASTLRIDTLLIASDIGGQAIDSAAIRNYMGFDFITGPELIKKFQEQLIKKHYIDHIISQVIKVVPDADGYKVHMMDSRHFTAKALIIATGMTRNRLNVPGEEEFQRKGVAYRVVHDASLFAGKDVAVVGGGNSAIQAAIVLEKQDSNVYLISLTDLTGDACDFNIIKKGDKIKCMTGYAVKEIKGKDTVENIVVKSIKTLEEISISVSGIFIEIGLLPNSNIVDGLVCLDRKGFIVVKKDCSTSRKGIFAAGDVTDAYGKRIIIASGEGAKAALASKEYLMLIKEKGGEL